MQSRYLRAAGATLFILAIAACSSTPPPEDAVSEAKRVCGEFGIGKDVNCLTSVYRLNRPKTASEILLGE